MMCCSASSPSSTTSPEVRSCLLARTHFMHATTHCDRDAVIYCSVPPSRALTATRTIPPSSSFLVRVVLGVEKLLWGSLYVGYLHANDAVTVTGSNMSFNCPNPLDKIANLTDEPFVLLNWLVVEGCCGSLDAFLIENGVTRVLRLRWRPTGSCATCSRRSLPRDDLTPRNTNHWGSLETSADGSS